MSGVASLGSILISALAVVSASIRSKAVVLLFLIHCFCMSVPFSCFFCVCFWSLFYNAVLYALFNSASISLREREREPVALL